MEVLLQILELEMVSFSRLTIWFFVKWRFPFSMRDIIIYDLAKTPEENAKYLTADERRRRLEDFPQLCCFYYGVRIGTLRFYDIEYLNFYK